MLENMASKWWVLLIRGIAAIAFGVLALIWPELTVGILVIFFGAYALVDGVFSLFTAFTGRNQHSKWWLDALEGAASIIFGILVFVWPGLSALVLLFMIGAWAIVTGVLEIVAAYQLRKEIEGEWLLILAGVASVVFGIIVFVAPGAGALALIVYIAAYAIVFGIALVALSIRMRSLKPGQQQA